MIVNEIFYSLQGEGFQSGTPAVFVRFSGCNLRCPFCDTCHENGTFMTEESIVDEVAKYPAGLVVVTGGEPSLQLTGSLVDKLHSLGKLVAVETNGTRELPANVDWITLSPKEAFLGPQATVVISRFDEVKVVYDGLHDPAGQLHSLDTKKAHLFLQPCDTGDMKRNIKTVQAAIEYIKQKPHWRLSLQIHKILNID